MMPSGSEALRVLVLVTSFPKSSETFVADHVAGLAAHKWEVHLCAYRIDPEGARAALGAPSSSVTFHRLAAPDLALPRVVQGMIASARLAHRAPLLVRSNQLRAAALLFPPVARLVRQLRPAAIHAHFGSGGLIAALAAGGLDVPVIVNFHGRDVTAIPQAEGWSAYRSVLRGAHLVAHSDFVAERVSRHIEGRLHRVQLGVDTSVFGAPARADRWRAPLRLLTVGRLIFAKGHDLAIDTLALVRSRRPDLSAELRIVGAGPRAVDLTRRARLLGLANCVHFAGGQSHAEVAASMANADVLLVPSLRTADGWEEAFCRVAVEGMAMGLLVVGLDTGGLGQTIGAGGIVVREASAAAVAKGLLDALRNDSPASVALLARRRAEAFSISRMQDDYEAVLTLACGTTDG